jgi:hypothetical protein
MFKNKQKNDMIMLLLQRKAKATQQNSSSSKQIKEDCLSETQNRINRTTNRTNN